MKFYAGIGSRSTPQHILTKMDSLARELSKLDWILRSGGAVGADSAFENGCKAVDGKTEIFKAEDTTIEAMELASKYHPAWDRCSPYVQKLHGRNMMIVLGHDLKSPCQMIICWTKNGQVIGGTGQALRCAFGVGIPVYNFGNSDVMKKLRIHMK